MKRSSKQRKYDIVIYVSLVIAFICVVISGIDYINSMDSGQSVKKEVKDALTELKEPEVEVVKEIVIEKEEEPEKMKEVDKGSVVKKFIDEIYDQIATNDFLSYEMVKSWKRYEVLDVVYIKEILEDYYAYQVNIKIYGDNPILPVDKNKDLSNDEYVVITLNFNILNSTKSNGYIVKTVEKPVN